MIDAKYQRRLLVETTWLLAADFPIQVAALPDFVHVPDELLLEYDSAFALVPQLFEAGLLSSEQFALAEAFNTSLDALVVDEDYEVALAAVERSPEWEAVREQARVLLAALGESLCPPDMSHAIYVR